MQRKKTQLQWCAVPVEKFYPALSTGMSLSVWSQGSLHLAGGTVHFHLGLPSGFRLLSQCRHSPEILISAAESAPLVTFSFFSPPQAPQSLP